jgi:hypothetical protein
MFYFFTNLLKHQSLFFGLSSFSGLSGLSGSFGLFGFSGFFSYGLFKFNPLDWKSATLDFNPLDWKCRLR